MSHAHPPRFVTRRPGPALRPFVEVLWACAAPDLIHRRERHLPSAEVQILVNLEADALHWSDGPGLDRHHRLNGAAVSGPFDRPIGLDTRDQRCIVGAVLRPGSAGVVLGLPTSVVARTHVALHDLPGLGHLRQRLLDAPPGRVLATFEALLLARSDPQRRDRAMGLACRALSAGSAVADVARRLGISPRTLRRRFTAAVGLSPKRYAGLIRFQRAVRRMASGPVDDWAGLALDLGYFDQAHFVRDFRAFSGVTPSAFAPRSAADHNHMAL